MKILVFVEVDVVVRHFLDSNSFSELAARHEVTFVFPELGHKRMGGIEPAKLNLAAPFVFLNHHARRTKLWKQLFHVDQLRIRKGEQAAAIRALRRFTLGWKASYLYTVLGLPGVWEVFRQFRLYQLSKLPNTPMEDLFDAFRPDAVVHPCVLEGLFLNDLIEICKHREVPLTVIMNSWDNPSTKRAMVGSPNWLLVWGEQTRRHAIDMAGMSSSAVVPFGAAQFEIFKQPSRLTREDFCEMNGLDPDRRILLYAGSSKGTDEIAHLKILDAAVAEGKFGEVSILYRPHPWGGGGKDGHRVLDVPWQHVLIESSMRVYLEQIRKGNAAKYLADYRDAHDVLTHVDAVVSPLSTILLEAAMLGKPILCFLPDADKLSQFKTDANLTHFHDMFRMPEILMAKGVGELLPKTKELMSLVEKPGIKETMVKAVDFFVAAYDEPYSKRLADFIESSVLTRVTE